MEQKIKQDPIYRCDICNGTGLLNNEKCHECLGMGVVLVLGEQVFYWGKKLSYLNIIQERNGRKLRVLINSLFFIFGVVGFLAFMKVLYDMQLAGEEIVNLVYIKNDFTQLWWLSMVADMYLVYRISKESKIKFLVKKKERLHLITEESKPRLSWRDIHALKKYEISGSFHQSGREIIEEVWLLAHKLKHAVIKNIHFFVILLKDSSVNMVFARLGVNYKDLALKVKSSLTRIVDEGSVVLGGEFREILLRSYLRAYNQRKSRVMPTDILFATTIIEGETNEILYEIEITEKEIAHTVEWVDLQRWLVRRWHEFKYKAAYKPKNAMNRSYTAIATPNLDAISRDMTLFARAGGYEPCIGREDEIDQIFRILEVNKLGAILIGEPGVGRNTVIEGIASLMVEEDVPNVLKDKRLVQLSVSGLIAGASRMGEMEKRILAVMSEVAKSQNIVLVIEDIHHMVGVSTESGQAMDVAEVLAEQMQAYNFMVLATTTPGDYKKYIEGSSLVKIMQKVPINEPNDDEAIQILEAKALMIEGKNQVYFSYQSISEAVKLSKQYLHDNYLPEKAIKLLEEVALTVKEKRGEKSVVTTEDIAATVANLTNIPLTKIATEESKKLLNLEEKMHERIIGQEEAVNLVSSALRRARTEMRKDDRPIASFLFLGSTGVGKTEVAKTLANIYFGSEESMIRVDMSEYQGDDAMAKLIGDARTGKGGYLTEAVRKSAFSLVLLDEVEKATSDILNVFLQVLDDGRLTEAGGQTVDFTNTIIIGTSNAGTKFIQQEMRQGTSLEIIREKLINQELNSYFRPELLNRFDGIVVFKPLELDQVEQIAKIFLNQLAARLEEKGVEFRVTDEALKELAAAGFNPTLGARPLRRVIQDKVEDKLAKLFLSESIARRDTIILKSGMEVEIKKADKI